MIGKYLTADGVWLFLVIAGSVLYWMVGIVLLVASPSRRTATVFAFGAIMWFVLSFVGWWMQGSGVLLAAGLVGTIVTMAVGILGFRKAS